MSCGGGSPADQPPEKTKYLLDALPQFGKQPDGKQDKRNKQTQKKPGVVECCPNAAYDHQVFGDGGGPVTEGFR